MAYISDTDARLVANEISGPWYTGQLTYRPDENPETCLFGSWVESCVLPIAPCVEADRGLAIRAKLFPIYIGNFVSLKLRRLERKQLCRVN